MHVRLVWDKEIRGGCYGTRTTWRSRGYNVGHMVLVILETVIFIDSLRFESWVNIQGRVGVSLVFLKVDSEDL